ncbi:MAG: DUF2304 domain-containing protein [Nanoarchaeota archaeon]
MVFGIQIIGVFFSLLMVYYIFLHFKRKEFGVKEFLFWFLLWIMFIVLTVFPQILDPITKSINLARKMDFFIVAGFFFLMGITTYTYTIIRKCENKIEYIVTKLAIKEAEEKERKDSKE